MREWKQNIANEICYLDNKDNYISINASLNETALRLKVGGGYETFIVMGNHKGLANSTSCDLDILEWFAENTNGFWSNDVSILKRYIADNFIK